MTTSVLCIGGTRFIGRQTVEELLTQDYAVTILTRGEHQNPFADHPTVSHHEGDRRDRATLEAAADSVDPDIVIDLCAYYPADVSAATTVFEDVAAYVYVSSGSAYDTQDIPMREDETPLVPCDEDAATDESMATYGARKAEGDRIIQSAAHDCAAMAVRPMLVYGPHDYTERFAYWVHRVAEYDQVLVPGDGGSLLHRVYVEDVARALRIVAEHGTPGEVYNVADRNTMSLGESLERIAEVLETDVEHVTASERELRAHDLEPTAFPLYTPRPAIAATEKLHRLGWDSTAKQTAIESTVTAHQAANRTGTDTGPDRDTEAATIEALTDSR